MPEFIKDSFLKKVTDRSPLPLTKDPVAELIRVYQDLERTLRDLKKTYDESAVTSIQYINVKKLIEQLSRSKKKLERKINNTLLLEKQQLKRRFKALTSTLANREKTN